MFVYRPRREYDNGVKVCERNGLATESSKVQKEVHQKDILFVQHKKLVIILEDTNPPLANFAETKH